jgi:hypothetical protein
VITIRHHVGGRAYSCCRLALSLVWVSATPNDDGATAAMTTNCGQLPTPDSVIGAAHLTTAQPRRGALGARSGRWQADVHRRRAVPRSGSGSAALPEVTTLEAATFVWAAAG